MKEIKIHLHLLIALFITSLTTANVLASRIVNTGIPFFGGNILIPGAVLAYAITFLITDIINENHGKQIAQKIVIIGVVAQMLAAGLIFLTGLLPAMNETISESYQVILGQNWVFVLASMTAYIIAQTWDIQIFHRIRTKWLKKHRDTRHRWIWNNLSTMSSQFIDTLIFITIAFGIGYGWLFTSEMVPVLFGMILGQYLVKLLISALDTPIFYIFTKKKKF